MNTIVQFDCRYNDNEMYKHQIKFNLNLTNVKLQSNVIEKFNWFNSSYFRKRNTKHDISIGHVHERIKYMTHKTVALNKETSHQV